MLLRCVCLKKIKKMRQRRKNCQFYLNIDPQDGQVSTEPAIAVVVPSMSVSVSKLILMGG